MQRFPDVEELIIGDDVKIEDDVQISGGKIQLGNRSTIKKGTSIKVTEELKIGKSSIIGEKNIINGRMIELGREFYSNHSVEIGGGSCFERASSLKIGYWFHIGSYSMVNTAMEVLIGNEVGLGRFSNIYSHGAYQSILNGFPVTFEKVEIGDNVWIPNGTVNPGITIGSNVVIGVGSLVNKDIPTGCLAAGIPCRIIKENAFPKEIPVDEKIRMIERINVLWDLGLVHEQDLLYSIEGKTTIDFGSMEFKGPVTKGTERSRNILRRSGIRFKAETSDGHYRMWDE